MAYTDRLNGFKVYLGNVPADFNLDGNQLLGEIAGIDLPDYELIFEEESTGLGTRRRVFGETALVEATIKLRSMNADVLRLVGYRGAPGAGDDAGFNPLIWYILGFADARDAGAGQANAGQDHHEIRGMIYKRESPEWNDDGTLVYTLPIDVNYHHEQIFPVTRQTDGSYSVGTDGTMVVKYDEENGILDFGQGNIFAARKAALGIT